MADSSGVEQQLLAATKIIEHSIDSEIERLDNLDGSELGNIRKERIDAMRKRASMKNEWINNGHGQYSELYDEKEFFEATKKSENVICHFYRDSFIRCQVLDKHLGILAQNHIESRFCKINAEKAPFLTERLKIRVLPTIVLVRKGKTVDFVVGFTDLGNADDFSTEMLEWRVARADVIEYAGDLLHPPSSKGKGNLKAQKMKIIRGGNDSDDEDSDY